MRKGREKGAIVVEATISLSAFMFAIFTILSIVNCCFVQARISVALNTAAKEISQYSYLYYALGVNNLESEFNKGTEDSKQLATDTIDGLGVFMSSLSGASASAQSGDFDKMINEINTGKNTAQSVAKKYSNAINDDPKGFILGMGKMATNELKEEGKVMLAQMLAKAFMEKNLKSDKNDDADSYLKSYGVVDGMDGLDFNYTTFLAYGNSNEIQLVVTYDIQVIKLLNFDYKFTIRQCSKTTAWGNGISKINPQQNHATVTGENIWNLGPGPRGKKIVELEKGKYTYTDSGHGFDAYDPNANKYITITSVETTDDSAKNIENVYDRLYQSRHDMTNKVPELGEKIQVTNKAGQTVEFSSDPGSRNYQVVLVVPDNANMQDVAAGVKQFKEKYPDVEVIVRNGYGNAGENDTKPE